MTSDVIHFKFSNTLSWTNLNVRIMEEKWQQHREARNKVDTMEKEDDIQAVPRERNAGTAGGIWRHQQKTRVGWREWSVVSDMWLK